MTKVLYSLSDLETLIKEGGFSKMCLVTSAYLAKTLEWAIIEIGIAPSEVITVPDGEKAKEWGELQKLLAQFSALNLDRKSLIIALGGGTVGDVVGFAASIYLRGIAYVQVPTTLLAQVDSAHGGKTGINFLGSKNQIGSFYVPNAIIIDERFIQSLSGDFIVDGLGEIIKAGFIKDKQILELLKQETVASLKESKRLKEIIERSIKVKEYHVQSDLDDQHIRQLLNAGHTIGHAIELKYGISHGKAVVAGMIQELEITEAMGLTEKGTKLELLELLNKMGIVIDQEMKADWDVILHDKKVMGDKIFFPVIKKAGESKLIPIDLAILKECIK